MSMTDTIVNLLRTKQRDEKITLLLKNIIDHIIHFRTRLTTIPCISIHSISDTSKKILPFNETKIIHNTTYWTIYKS